MQSLKKKKKKSFILFSVSHFCKSSLKNPFFFLQEAEQASNIIKSYFNILWFFPGGNSYFIGNFCSVRFLPPTILNKLTLSLFFCASFNSLTFIDCWFASLENNLASKLPTLNHTGSDLLRATGFSQMFINNGLNLKGRAPGSYFFSIWGFHFSFGCSQLNKQGLFIFIVLLR